jgi:aspartate/methionine/tyrosine aminotransferase
MAINKQAEELNLILKNCNTSIFELLSKKGQEIYYPKEGILAQSAQAKEKKINATIGIANEDDSSPMKLSGIASKVLLEPKDVFPYAPSDGKKDLREAWKQLMIEKNPSLKAPISLPVVTNALTHGLSIVGFLFLNEGDNIIMPDLYWGNYKLCFTNWYGANIKTFSTFKEGKFDLDSMKNSLTGSGKKVLLLNFPNNPTGYTPTKEEASEIIRIIKSVAESGEKICVILDDAYFGLFYEEETQKESLFSKLADLHENVLAIKLDGATKEDYVWGLRVGFITYGFKGATKEAYEALEYKTSGAIRGNISNASNLSQSLVLTAIKAPNYKDEKAQKFEILKERYELVKKVLLDKKYETQFVTLPYNSGYFMCIKPLHAKAEEVRQKLLAKYDTGVIALGDIIRVSFSSVPKQNISLLFDNIFSACAECETK